MQLSKMVEENISDEELEIIEEKKKCKKNLKASKDEKSDLKKGEEVLTEEGMKYCAECGTEYNAELEACPSCESTETTTQIGALELLIAKQEAAITANTVEDVATAETKLAADKEKLQALKDAEEAAKTAEPVEGETEALPAPEEATKPVVEAVDKEAAVKKVEAAIKSLESLLDQGQEAQANGNTPPQGFEGAQEQLRKTLVTLNTMKGKVETKISESEVIAEADILVDTVEETNELEYLKSLSGI